MPEIDFLGKSEVLNHHLSIPTHQLEPIKKKSVGEPSMDGNLIIHGDNLLALKSLLPRYAGRVKCIYIDPPYNTGKEGWCYNDKVNSPLMKNWLGKVVDSEDLSRHDKWLCMMWPRLQLFRELLSDDGVIFVSCDDNEQHRLREITDEIFGEENFIGCIIWNSTKSVTNTALISVSHTYNFVYVKDVNYFIKNRYHFRLSEEGEGFENPDNDPRGLWKADPFQVGGWRPNQQYKIKNPKTGEIYKPNEGHSWKNDKEKFQELLADRRIVFGISGEAGPQRKRFLSEAKERGRVSKTLWDDVGTTTHGTKIVKKIFNGKSLFSNPKPVDVIKRMIQLGDHTHEGIILDSFAGSGTTAHAVLELNKEDGGNRKFILVECEDYANKITAERVRRVIKGVPKAKDATLKKGLGGSFTYCELGSAIDRDKILKGESLPEYNALASLLFSEATGESLRNKPTQDKKTWFVGETKDYRVHVIYKKDPKFLHSNEAMLNLALLDKIKKGLKKNQKAIVFACGRFIDSHDLRDGQVLFCYLPHEMHR